MVSPHGPGFRSLAGRSRVCRVQSMMNGTFPVPYLGTLIMVVPYLSSMGSPLPGAGSSCSALRVEAEDRPNGGPVLLFPSPSVHRRTSTTETQKKITPPIVTKTMRYVSSDRDRSLRRTWIASIITQVANTKNNKTETTKKKDQLPRELRVQEASTVYK